MTVYTIEIPDTSLDMTTEVNLLFDFIDDTENSQTILNDMFNGKLSHNYYTEVLRPLGINLYRDRLNQLLWDLAMECYECRDTKEKDQGGGLLTASPPLV